MDQHSPDRAETAVEKAGALEPNNRDSAAYIVQVGAFISGERAREMVESLKEHYPAADSIMRDYNDRSYHVVYVGAFPQAEEALTFAETVKVNKGLKAFAINVSRSGYIPVRR